MSSLEASCAAACSPPSPVDHSASAKAKVLVVYPYAYAYRWRTTWTIYATRPGDPGHMGLSIGDGATPRAAWAAALATIEESKP